MLENQDETLEIQVSSTTLGYTGEGGKVGGASALVEELFSKERYTETVLENAEKFREVTEQEIPEATFGVSVLASAVKPEQLQGIIRSVDYPYHIKWGTNFVKEKWEKGQKEGQKGLGAAVALGQELAYALLQSPSASDQRQTTLDAARLLEVNPVRIRTCMETVSMEEDLNRIKGLNAKLGQEGKNVIWVVEPNRKMGDGTLQSYMDMYEQLIHDNSGMQFGIDLDLGGLPNEDTHILEILDRLDRNNRLPIFLSVSGRDVSHGDVRTHLPIGKDTTYNTMLASWFFQRMYRGQKLPGIVVETSPTQPNVLKDYADFLKSFKQGR